MTDFYALMRPLLFCLDAELAHQAAIAILRHDALLATPQADDPLLQTKVAGLTFSNPLGMAAGFDKNAETIAGTLKLGFGFTEVGTVTPKPQFGNPRPRVFRVPSHQAVINRYGFNNRGLDYFVKQLQDYRARNNTPRGLVGVNVGKNKDAADGADDFITCIKATALYADYLVINVSSPNTPGLRGLQNKKELEHLLAAAKNARDDGAKRPPLFVKLAPDLTADMQQDIAAVLLASGIDGMILTNTTVTRPPDLAAHLQKEAGGLSGAPLKDMATDIIRAMHHLTEGKLPIIGVGGISNGQDATDKIQAGASLVQLYTGLIYQGPGLVAEIKQRILALRQLGL